MSNDELEHFGIKGQKWGVRRYTNFDGSLTPEGERRYGVDANGRMTAEGKNLYKQDLASEKKDINYLYERAKKKDSIMMDRRTGALVVADKELGKRYRTLAKAKGHEYTKKILADSLEKKDRVKAARHAGLVALATIGVSVVFGIANSIKHN